MPQGEQAGRLYERGAAPEWRAASGRLKGAHLLAHRGGHYRCPGASRSSRLGRYLLDFIPRSSSGRTLGSGPRNGGSNPSRGARYLASWVRRSRPLRRLRSVRHKCEHAFVMRREIAEAIRSGLAAGKSRAEIARTQGISPSTVTRYARILGIPDARSRPSKTDWGSVQAYYDEGRSIEECRTRFGITLGAWDKAVCRGDLKTRPRANGELARGTRDRVEQLLADSMSQAAIARELNLSKSTVAFHVRRLGRRADPRFARRYKWSDVQDAIDNEGLSMTRCCERFGFCAETWYTAVRAGKIVPRPPLIPVEQLLVTGRRGTNRTHLKKRMIQAGLKDDRCEICGISEWLGRPLTIEVHHVNGDGLDNRLENLQLLCANCHSQTDTWGGRGAKGKNAAARSLKPPA